MFILDNIWTVLDKRGDFSISRANDQILKKPIVMRNINVQPGETIAVSKGLRLYDMYFEVANLRLGRSGEKPQ